MKKQCLVPRPEKGRRPGYVLHAPWRGFAERPWFDALLSRGTTVPASSDDTPESITSRIPLPVLSAGEWERVVRVLGLTPREADVVQLLLQAKQDKQIASILRVRFYTVRSHLRHVFAKLHITDRSELILRVFGLLRSK